MLAFSVKCMKEVFENKVKMFYAYEIAEEKQTLQTDQSNQGSSIGVTFSAGTMVSVNGQFYSGQDKENGSATAYKGSTVTVADTLTMKSGQDTDIVGSAVAGNKANIDVGGNIAIESLYDDWHTYSGTRLLKVWGYDLVPLGFGAVGGYFLSYPGAISGSVAGDRAKDYFKDQVPTDRDIKAVKGSRQ